MDNKITKSRISNFFSYEWIMLIAVAVVSIIVWELVYTVTAVRLTVGQEFKVYYDYGIYANGGSLLVEEVEDDAFSFDVLKIDYETLLRDNDVLNTRLSVHEGDVIFTDVKVKDDLEANEYPTNQANTRIDSISTYDYDLLVKDAEDYLKQFLQNEGADPLVYANLSESKIEEHFDVRMGKDNRYRDSAERVKGKQEEKARIEKLCGDVKYLKDYIALDDAMKGDPDYADKSLFYSYRKYDQTVQTASDVEQAKNNYKNVYDENSEPLRYGLRMDKLTGNSNKLVTNYLQLKDVAEGEPATAKDIVLLIFNFREQQPDLQFEALSFTVEIIKLFTTPAV